MEQETARSYNQVPYESNQEDLIMVVPEAVGNTLECQNHKQQICQSVHNLGRVDSGIIVLSLISTCTLCPSSQMPDTSSHQLSVEVTGLQYPSCEGGYGNEGTQDCISILLPVCLFGKPGHGSALSAANIRSSSSYRWNEWERRMS